MFKKLRNQILLSNLVLAAAVLLGAFTVVLTATYLSAKQDIYTKILALPAAFHQGNVSTTAAPGSVLYYLTEAKVDSLRTESAEFFVLLTEESGKISVHDKAYGRVEEYFQTLANTAWEGKKTQSIVPMPKNALWAYIVPSEEYKGEYEIYFLNVAQYQNSIIRLLKTFLWVGILSFFCIFLISWYIAGRAVKPIAESWEKQRRFVADASHELKTPLAIIAANAEALAADDGSEREKWLRYIQDEVRRMTRLVSDLLYLAKSDDIAQSDEIAEFNLSACIHDMLTRYETLAYEKGILLERNIADGILITCNQDKLCKVLSILMDNAEKYTNPKGTITVVLDRGKNTIVLSIKNTGKGIPEEDLPYIFDRFYRVDKSRSSENSGYGLGLSIAKNIVAQLGGEISVSSVENEHTTFQLKFKQ